MGSPEGAVIYLDHNATTPLDPRALEYMMPYLTGKFGNASSSDHRYGLEAAAAVEEARGRVASLIGARPSEIVFTSGATESDNLAVAGGASGRGLVTCSTEHEAVLEAAAALERSGGQVRRLGVGRDGIVEPSAVGEAITDETAMVSVMAANNEIGTMPDLEAIGKITREKGVMFHTDAAQAAGHAELDVERMNIDLMSLSSHKMYGPKGVGALYVRGLRPRVRLEPQMLGGGQERGMRSGTSNVPAIAGFGRAAQIASDEMEQENAHLLEYRRAMMESLAEAGGVLNGHPDRRLAGNLSVQFPGVESKAVISAVSDRVAISAGSACAADSVEPSHVLLAIGLGEAGAHSSIRIGIGRFNTADDIDVASEAIVSAVRDVRRVAG